MSLEPLRRLAKRWNDLSLYYYDTAAEAGDETADRFEAKAEAIWEASQSLTRALDKLDSGQRPDVDEGT